MHRCLMIPEIRLQICNEIYESDATLAAMAQSCRTFEEPALSILWRWLGSLKPVMGCLPGDLWAEQSGARTMRRATVPSDWERFLSNAKRVREFHFDEQEVDPSWIMIASQCPGGILFPNLRRLFYYSNSNDHWPWLKVFAAPTLQTLILDLVSANQDGITIISDLPQACPAIIDLTVMTRVTVPLFSDLICSWQDLHCIRVSECDARVLTHLSLMCNLSELSISGLYFPPSTHFTFPALRTLRLDLCDFNPSLEFMRRISAACLSTLDISLTTQPQEDPIEWGLLFRVISERLSDAPLSEFGFYDMEDGDSADYIADDIRPLYIFPNVTTFNFGADTLHKLDDHRIQEVAAAWPNLTTLRLGQSHSQVTVAGLAFLVQKCQNLSTFHLEIDGRIIGPLLEDKACGSMPNVRMESISLGFSPIEDTAQVAMVLARALPNLRRIEVIDDSNMEGSDYLVYAKRWKEVEALVRDILEDGVASRSKQG